MLSGNVGCCGVQARGAVSLRPCCANTTTQLTSFRYSALPMWRRDTCIDGVGDGSIGSLFLLVDRRGATCRLAVGFPETDLSTGQQVYKSMSAGRVARPTAMQPDLPVDRLAARDSGRRTLSMTRSSGERAVTTVEDHYNGRRSLTASAAWKTISAAVGKARRWAITECGRCPSAAEEIGQFDRGPAQFSAE
jgi:hypothetical protein